MMLAQRVGRENLLALNRAVEMIYDARYSQALPELERLTTVFNQAGAAGLAAETVFWQGFCREKLGGLEEPMALYLKCIKRDSASRASRLAAERFTRLQQIGRARLEAGQANAEQAGQTKAD